MLNTGAWKEAPATLKLDALETIRDRLDTIRPSSRSNKKKRQANPELRARCRLTASFWTQSAQRQRHEGAPQ